MFADEIEREKLVNKREIVVNAADFKDFLSTQTSIRVPAAALFGIVALFVLLAEGAAVPAVLDIAKQFNSNPCRD